MKESSANTILNQYLREKKLYCFYELKVAKGNTFNFSKIEDNQDEGLPALAKEGMVWKWSDEDSRKKPCDGGCLPPLPAYLVIKFKTLFIFIDYARIIELKDQGVKSITRERARELSTKIVNV